MTRDDYVKRINDAFENGASASEKTAAIEAFINSWSNNRGYAAAGIIRFEPIPDEDAKYDKLY